MHTFTSIAATLLLALAISSSSSISQVSSFIIKPTSYRAVTHLNLEDHIAEMIDNEVERLHHFKDWKKKQDEKLRKDIEQYVEKGFDFNSVTNFQPDPSAAKKIQMRKDKRMARTDPMKYCADRCVSTGSCEVWEDLFDMKADEVQKFCNECVLSEDEEPCEVPEKFIENAGLNPWDLHP